MSKQHLRQPRLFSFGLVRKSHLRPCSSPVAVRWPSGHADVLVHVQDDADAVMTSKLPAAERRAVVTLASAADGAADALTVNGRHELAALWRVCDVGLARSHVARYSNPPDTRVLGFFITDAGRALLNT